MSETARAIFARIVRPPAEDENRLSAESVAALTADALAQERRLTESARLALARNSDDDEIWPLAVDTVAMADRALGALTDIEKAIKAEKERIRALRQSLAAAILPAIPSGRGAKIEGGLASASRRRGKATAKVVDREALDPKYWIHPDPYPDQETLDTLASKGVCAEGCEIIPGQDTISFSKKDTAPE